MKNYSKNSLLLEEYQIKIKESVLKRSLDLILSLVGIVFSSPICLIIAIAIKLEDGESIFYTQERVGLNRKMFKVIKFRTMNTVNKNSSEFANLLRKTALDELPQLINILKGQMSFVGPRPPPYYEMNNWAGFNLRFKIKPGLTGVAQILLPKDSPVSKKYKYDIWYIKNQSFCLDLRLICLSFFISFKRGWDRTIKSI